MPVCESASASPDEDVPDWELHRLWKDATDEAGAVTLPGDLVLAAFFEGSKSKEREEHRQRFSGDVLNETTDRYRSWLGELRDNDPPLAPFHWEIEFPEVFDRVAPGFDAIVGNPPFAGKNTVIAANRPGYPDWLKQMHTESHGNADLVAHFFRRAFNLTREGGAFGLIATNTIAQGDTRSTGLRWILRERWRDIPCKASAEVAGARGCRRQRPSMCGRGAYGRHQAA